LRFRRFGLTPLGAYSNLNTNSSNINALPFGNASAIFIGIPRHDAMHNGS